jgi:hypothetical protein
MSVTATVLVSAKTAELVQTVQYTADRVTALIDKFTGTNYGTTPATLRVYLVERAGTAGDDNLCAIVTVPPYGTYLFPEIVGHVLLSGGSISTIATGTISIRVSGREVS